MSNFFAARWRVIAADPHPNHLAMTDMFERSQVLLYNFKNHLGAEIQDAISAKAWEILAQSLCQRVLDRPFTQRFELFANKVGLWIHRRPPFVARFFSPGIGSDRATCPSWSICSR